VDDAIEEAKMRDDDMTFGEMLEEVANIGGGLTVALLPLLALALPGILLVVVPLAVLALPLVVIGGLLALPFLLARTLRRRA
jgi:hypothetical protein